MKIGIRLAKEFGVVWCHEPDKKPDTSDLEAPRTVVPTVGNTQDNFCIEQVARQPIISWR